jgi:hypothetical protein
MRISGKLRKMSETVSENAPHVHFLVYGDAHVTIVDLGPFPEMAL